VLRVLALPLVAATVVLFGSGVAFLVLDESRGTLETVHAASFAVWGVIMVVHVLVYLSRVLKDGVADWRSRHALAGSAARRAVVVGSLAAGVAVALATYSLQTSWLAQRHRHHRESKTAVPPGVVQTAHR
jgi:hypothetical protein